jgi:hypothetical protein
VPAERRLASWHAVEEDGTVRSAGAGFASVFRALPGGRPFAALCERYPGAAERAYQLVATRRGRLGPLVPAAVKRRADALLERRR